MSNDRLQPGELPKGSRNDFTYTSPHNKPNDSYNFWRDIETNVRKRNSWEDRNNYKNRSVDMSKALSHDGSFLEDRKAQLGKKR